MISQRPGVSTCPALPVIYRCVGSRFVESRYRYYSKKNQKIDNIIYCAITHSDYFGFIIASCLVKKRKDKFSESFETCAVDTR